MTPTAFAATLKTYNIQVSQAQMDQFELYFKRLVQVNQQVNLTAITEQEAVYLKHFFDSVTPTLYLEKLRTEPLTICDIGAGAGFPSLPIKILFPQLKITIVDSLNKRIHFLEELVRELGLSDVTLVHDRAELFSNPKSPYREQFDIVTARAVASLNVLAEFCLPTVKVGGQFIALKASQGETELAEANYAIETLGGQFAQDIALTLPETDDQRHLIVIDKVAPTPAKYPRRAGVPVKKPLMAKEEK
ncbi:16S rRNA (guanine(527)-N(7))-methyltransferase RsmG [Latilactobacillus curvatus]|uniref:Ribosomal RNA small subunit methyltransferase G n=1 Tax=Latilactobacillus curvatus TaxID=28038 RepID=A0ABN6GIE8_LATCU|nr:16S rRNA (guanine(527)-N(7))-methyltransferase RsmG [Latilactobacillus curvatus]ANJ68586.1 16S rRNA (guanine(527)-N(7))-methyltransferase [Latilactobacillus curvatus]AOO74617.1 16S rRNA (guanine(527)-N(7))-methyltransferase [Latilactobacillus curvatus]QEA48976.1 16S rRNA (guanine(527)-N(7))-methyltransferase RsmG [Latilactobacillus curvatus]WBY48913.1 16S rRNA (guanine(527)-N(7))-methyltransferase RsmG [Latilactobacillus curvatus]WIE00830.1 16S rRNA (guanine(527)-N(7))-methyltransferase Rsm